MNINASSNSKNDGLAEALGQLESYRVVVFGGSGLIGSDLVGKINCIAPSSKECDIRDFSAVQRFIKKTEPTLVVNLAGESRADRCNSDAAWSINANALTNICYSLATYCKGAKLFQAGSINEFLSPSSDYARQKTKAASIANSYSRIINFIDAKFCTVENGYREGFIISELARMTKTYLSYGVTFTINDMSASKWVVDASTMSDAVITCCANKSEGQFYFGPQAAHSLEEIFCEICSQLGINTVKNGKSWIDADNGRVIMNSRNYQPSPICSRNFGDAFGGGLTSDLRKIISSIIISS